MWRYQALPGPQSGWRFTEGFRAGIQGNSRKKFDVQNMNEVCSKDSHRLNICINMNQQGWTPNGSPMRMPP